MRTRHTRSRKRLLPGATRKRRTKGQTKRELAEIKREHRLLQDLEDDLPGRNMSPDGELLLRRILRGQANHQLLEPMGST